jgi:membrane protein
LSPAARRGRTLARVAIGVLRRALEHAIPARAGELAYTFVFAIFPLLFFFVTLLGYLADAPGGVIRTLFSYLRGLTPSPAVSQLLENTLAEIVRGRGGAKLSLSLLATIWVGSSGVLALGRILNTARGCAETRPWWWRRLLAMAITVINSALCVTALSLIFYGRQIGEAIADRVGEGPVFGALWHFLKWPLALSFLLLAFDLVYAFAPNHQPAVRWRWVTPGALVAIGLWLAASMGLRFFLNTAVLTSAYGSLTAFFLLLVWFYLTGLAVLIGGLVNFEFEDAGARKRPAKRSRVSRSRGGSVVGRAG